MQNNTLDKKVDLFSKFSKMFRRSSTARGNMMAAGAKQDKEDDQSNELYDVDRWREAERQAQWERDVTGRSGSNIEQVRRKWNKDDDPDDMSDISSGSADTAVGMERSDRAPRVNSVYARISNDQKISETAVCSDIILNSGKNYLGLSVHAGIDDFFSSNPINSCLLAGDSLSIGYLSMDQTGARSYVDRQDVNIEKADMKPEKTENISNDTYMQRRREESMKKRDDVRIL